MMGDTNVQGHLHGRNDRPRIQILNLAASIAMGGAERVMLSMASAIDGCRFDYRFCLFIDLRRPACELYALLKEEGRSVTTIEIMKTVDWRQLAHCWKIIKNSKPALLHTHGHRSDFFGLLMAKCMGIPIVATVHGWTSSTSRLRLYEPLHRWGLKYFDVVIAVSEEIRLRLVEAGVRPENVVTVTNAIDVSTFSSDRSGIEFRKEMRISPEAKVIGTVGRLSLEKGLEYFLRAGAQIIAKDSSVTLLLVGEGPQRRELEALAESLGISSSVVFCGYRRDVERIYPAFDIFVLPSLTEGLPIALLEAMACTRPVVASRVGGIPSVIQDGVTGLLVEPTNVGQLVDAFRNLLDDPELGRGLGVSARQSIERRFGVSEWIKNIESIYLRVAS
jgi:glycosyltransferase involved in cell wall biosynthesis